MKTLKTLKRPTKWRENVRKDLTITIDSGFKIYGVRRDGKYVEKTSIGDRIVAKRSVKGAVAAKRAAAD